MWNVPLDHVVHAAWQGVAAMWLIPKGMAEVRWFGVIRMTCSGQDTVVLLGAFLG